MQESSTGGSSPEAASIQEQGAIRSLALDVQEVVGIYKKERAAGRDGTDIPLVFLASDVKQLKDLGVLEKYKDPLTKIGADPIIRFAILSQINQAGQNYEQATDKSAYLENIRMHLELGEALGLDQTAGNPDFEAAAKLFNDFKEKYSTLEPTSETASPTPLGAHELVENATFDEVLAQLQKIDPKDEKIQEYLDLLDKLNDSSLPDKFRHLVGSFNKGLTPTTLTELTELSEYATAKLEELGILNPASHEKEVKNVRNTLYVGLTNLPQEQAPTTSISMEVTKTRVPDKTSGQDLIKLVNKFLKEPGADTRRNVEVNPEVLARYIKETVKLPQGANFSSVPEVKIVKDERGENILEINGKIGTPLFNASGTADFHLIIANKPDGGIEIVKKDIQATGKVKEEIDKGEDKIGTINQTLIDQTNQRIDPDWETASFHIADDIIVFEFRKKQPSENMEDARRQAAQGLADRVQALVDQGKELEEAMAEILRQEKEKREGGR